MECARLQQTRRSHVLNKLPRAAIASLAKGENAVDPRVAHHLVHVLRLRAGDRFLGFDPASGREAIAVVAISPAGAVSAHVDALEERESEAVRPVTLLQSIAKADKCDAIVRDATELGATEIVLFPSIRSVVRLDGQRRDARLERWKRIADEAARQSRRTLPPLVTFATDFRSALLGVPQTAARFCLYEESRSPLAEPLHRALTTNEALAFAVGPEGGFDPGEVAIAVELGWTLSSLGARILRTETVGAAVLGAALVFGSQRAGSAPGAV